MVNISPQGWIMLAGFIFLIIATIVSPELSVSSKFLFIGIILVTLALMVNEGIGKGDQ